jgi:hypothetical protein
VGRNAQGVRLINLGENDKVVDIALCEKQPPELQDALEGGHADGTMDTAINRTSDTAEHEVNTSPQDPTDDLK